MDAPTLEEVLQGGTFSPFTLPEFLSFLENFHCLENLEFIIGLEDMERASHEGATTEVSGLWNEIYHRFVLETAPQEVNLPCKVKTQLLNINPNNKDNGLAPSISLIQETKKLVNEVLRDSYCDYCRHIKKRISELVPPCTFVGLPTSPESLNSIEEVNYILPTLFKPVPTKHFTNFKLDKPSFKDDVLYTLPSELPSPIQRRISDPITVPEVSHHFNNPINNSSGEEDHIFSSDIDLKSSRQNSASSSSRGSSFGSIVDTLKIGGDHMSWRRAVKKFRIRRFLNDYQIDESELKE